MSTRDSLQGSATVAMKGSITEPIAPQYTGPTPAITAVANAITVERKSLDILVSVAPLLTRGETAAVARPGGSLYPVTISIAFISTVGAERQTQAYSALAGNRFVHADPEAEGQPRSVHLDITLSEPNPKGGEYSFNVPFDVELDPLYDVVVYPLEFTLLNSSAIIGIDDGRSLFCVSRRERRLRSVRYRCGQNVQRGGVQMVAQRSERLRRIAYSGPRVLRDRGLSGRRQFYTGMDPGRASGAHSRQDARRSRQPASPCRRNDRRDHRKRVSRQFPICDHVRAARLFRRTRQRVTLD